MKCRCCYLCGLRLKWFADGPAEWWRSLRHDSCLIKIQNSLMFWCLLANFTTGKEAVVVVAIPKMFIVLIRCVTVRIVRVRLRSTLHCTSIILFFLNIHIIGSSERDWFIYRPMPGYRLLYHLLLYVGTWRKTFVYLLPFWTFLTFSVYVFLFFNNKHLRKKTSTK